MQAGAAPQCGSALFVCLKAKRPSPMKFSLHSARDLLLLAMSFNCVHVGLQVTSDDVDPGRLLASPSCPYVRWYAQVFLWLVMLVSMANVTAHVLEWNHNMWWAVGVDVGAVPIGLFLMTTTSSPGWYGAASVAARCSATAVPYASSLYSLGQLLTFGTAVRLGIHYYGNGKSALGVAIVCVGSFALSGLVYLTGAMFREIYHV
jgi:hypothetical protein